MTFNPKSFVQVDGNEYKVMFSLVLISPPPPPEHHSTLAYGGVRA